MDERALLRDETNLVGRLSEMRSSLRSRLAVVPQSTRANLLERSLGVSSGTGTGVGSAVIGSTARPSSRQSRRR